MVLEGSRLVGGRRAGKGGGEAPKCHEEPQQQGKGTQEGGAGAAAAPHPEIESNVSSPQDLPPRPDMEKVMLEADVEIFKWVLQAEEIATSTANREVESWIR